MKGNFESAKKFKQFFFILIMGTEFKNIYYVSFRPSQRTVNGKSDQFGQK